MLEKIREDMTGGPTIVFTRKAVANETFVQRTKHLCKSIVGIDTSQDCIRDGTTIKKHKNNRQGRVEFDRLKIRSCHNFKQPDLNANTSQLYYRIT